MERVNVELLRKQLLEKIDISDLKEVEKIERYCSLLELIQECMRKVADEGISIVTENASQRFLKSHPLMADISKLNAQLITLEKSMLIETPEVKSVKTRDKKEKLEVKVMRGGLL